MKQIFNPQWNRIPRKTKKRHPELFRHLLEEIRSDELQNLGYEYIMIRDFLRNIKVLWISILYQKCTRIGIKRMIVIIIRKNIAKNLKTV